MILEHAVKTSNVLAVRDILRTASLEAMDETDFNGRTPLMLACFRGNVDVIRMLIKGGAGTHSRDKWGKTALMYAVQRGHVEVIRELLKIHADASARDNDRRIVEGFARPGSLTYDTIVKLLRDSQMEFQESRSRAGSPLSTPIVSPVGSPNIKTKSPATSFDSPSKAKTVHDIERRGILPDIKTPPPVDESLVKHDAPFCFKDPLELARRGLDKELKAILPQVGGVSKYGLDEGDAKGRTPLMVAILNGKLESCLIIIKAGGEINGRDFTGKTVLFYAIAKRNMEAVNALIGAGADPEAVDNFGRTPLMQACMDGNVLATRALLSAGAKLTDTDNKGRTALMYAVAKGSIPTVEELVLAGADPTADDNSGKRVDQFALTRVNFNKLDPILKAARADWKSNHPTIHDSFFPETYSFQSPPSSPSPPVRSPTCTLPRDDSFFGSPSRAHTASSAKSRKRIPPMIASPFNPKANRSCLDLVRVADYVALDAFLDGCTLVAINEQDKNGRTALTVAVLQQKLIPLQMLIDAGADLEVKDNQGKTALAHAAATRNIKSINMLLEAGAYVHPMDANGRTPLDQAELGGDDEVFELLMAASSPKKKKASGSRASSFEESKTEEADQELLRQRDVDESKEADDILRIDCD